MKNCISTLYIGVTELLLPQNMICIALWTRLDRRLLCKKQRDKFRVENISLLYFPVKGRGWRWGRESVVVRFYWQTTLIQFAEHVFWERHSSAKPSLGSTQLFSQIASTFTFGRRQAINPHWFSPSLEISKKSIYFNIYFLLVKVLSYHQSQSPHHWMIYRV